MEIFDRQLKWKDAEVRNWESQSQYLGDIGTAEDIVMPAYYLEYCLVHSWRGNLGQDIVKIRGTCACYDQPAVFYGLDVLKGEHGGVDLQGWVDKQERTQKFVVLSTEHWVFCSDICSPVFLLLEVGPG